MCDFFAGNREELLSEVEWSPSADLPPYFIDCRTPTDKTAPLQGSFRHGLLDETEIPAWLAQKVWDPQQPVHKELLTGNRFLDKFQVSHTTPVSPADKQALRLLLFDIGNRRRPQLFISRTSFHNVDVALNLHPATIPCMFRKGGLALAFRDVDPLDGALTRLSVITRSPHAGAAGCRFLSMTHDLRTRLTTGIILGDGITASIPHDAGYSLNLRSILTLLKSTRELWEYPTLVAAIMLWTRVDYFHGHSQKIMANFADLEHAVGVTDTKVEGAASVAETLDKWPGCVDIKRVTMQIHTVAKKVVFLEDVTKWQRRCAECLLGIEKELEASFSQDMVFRSQSSNIKDVLRYILSTTDGIEAVVRSMQQRVQMQINVLASAASQKDNLLGREQNMIAQKSNQLNIEIATSTKKDSIAMMTFTFITALFVPGTYIASLFSMSMFDWQAESSSTDQGHASTTVSRKFWIYWIVSCPLTAIVMLGWFLWYRVADVTWRRETGLLSVNRTAGRNKGEA